MAEVEFGDLKISGGKLLLAIPFLGSVMAALWGGFELYQRLLTAEEAVTSYVSPDFSSYDEGLAVLTAKVEAAERLIQIQEDAMLLEIQNLQDRYRSLQGDIDSIEDLARSSDDTIADTSRELRDDVYGLEERVNDSIREVNQELRDIREDLSERIERILDNPLNSEE